MINPSIEETGGALDPILYKRLTKIPKDKPGGFPGGIKKTKKTNQRTAVYAARKSWGLGSTPDRRLLLKSTKGLADEALHEVRRKDGHYGIPFVAGNGIL